MFLFQNIWTFFMNRNSNLKLEYNYKEDNEAMCNCTLCYFANKYISPIICFICFELKIKK